MKITLIIAIVASCVAATSLQALTLDQLLKKHAEAMGGLDKLSSVKSAVVKAETNLGGMVGTTVTYYKDPDKIRIDLTLPIVSYKQACDGDNCWQSDARGLTHSLSGDLKRLLNTQIILDHGTYLDPKTFPGKIQLLDSLINVDGLECHQVEVAPDNGCTAILAIDKKHYLIRRVRVVTDLAQVYSYPSDYREVEGIMIAYQSEERTEAGMSSGSNKLQSIEFNVDLADSLFVLREDDAGQNSGGKSPVTVPFELYRNHTYFQASISGQGPFQFIFDTGAGGFGLNKDLVERLKLTSIGEIEAQGVGGSDLTQVYQIDSISIGDLTLSNVPVYSMDLAPLQAAGTQRIDGIIGYDLLSRFPVTIDYEHSTLTIHRATANDLSEWGNECRLSLDFQLPYIDARVNGSVVGRFRLDTGSGSTIDLNSPFVERNNLAGGDPSDYIEVMAYGIGGGSKGLIGQLEMFELCDYRLDTVLVNFSTSEKGIFAGEQTAGNIGAGILKRFIVTFDYQNEAVYFKPVSHFDQLNRIRNMAGVLLETSRDTLHVVQVLSGRAAEGVLMEGDRITSIAFVSAIGMTIEQANRLLIGGKNSAIPVKFLRDGKPLSAELILDSLY